MNFSQALKSSGIIESKAMATLRRLRTIESRRDRHKVWPGDIGRFGQDLLILNTTNDTAQYVQAWCDLNNLKL